MFSYFNVSFVCIVIYDHLIQYGLRYVGYRPAFHHDRVVCVCNKAKHACLFFVSD